MRKLHIELPKHRLEVNLKLVKRRKSVFDEALIPSVTDVKKKYRKGSLAGRYFRHVFEHKSIKKILSGTIASAVILASFFPPKTSALAQGNEDQITINQTATLSTQKAIQLPVENFRLNQGFGLFHPAIDLGGKVGDAIKPIKAGEVVEAGYEDDGYGNTIVINHGNGLTSRYAHLSKIEASIGEKVTTENEIGKMGETGHATGPHLHLEIHQNGIPLNPLMVIPR